MNEKILRHFDISSQYGPCIGIPRLRRWKRADGLGLNPPLEVLAVLLREQKTNKGKGEMAYLDELAGGKAAHLDDLAGGRVALIE
jgi:DNA polymerase delta subunit 4